MAEAITVLASAERTTAQAVSVNVPYGAQSVSFVTDVTVDGAAASITPSVNGKFGAIEWVMLTGSAIAAVGTTAIHVGPSLTASAGVSAAVPLPEVVEFNMAVADTDAITYSVTAFFS